MAFNRASPGYLFVVCVTSRTIGPVGYPLPSQLWDGTYPTVKEGITLSTTGDSRSVPATYTAIGGYFGTFGVLAEHPAG